jgi:hypothetical protein
MTIQTNNKKIADSFQSERLVKDLERLTGEATQGSYQAQQRYEAIQRLVDPTLDFCDSDLRRILNKGHSPQVQKGLRLYRLMQKLTVLVEPIGDKTGSVCPVRLIPFEEATSWEMFLEIRFPITGDHLERAFKMKKLGRFNGEAVLNEQERKLLRRLKPYFGSRKKPTLQSLAINLLNEEGNGKGFSGRALYNYLEAVREYRTKKQQATATSFSFTFYAVESFGKSQTKTVKESLHDMNQALLSSFKSISISVEAFTEHLIKPALLNARKPSFDMLDAGIGRALEGMKENFYKNFIPPKDFGLIIAKAVGFDTLPRINLYKNLQG